MMRYTLIGSKLLGDDGHVIELDSETLRIIDV